MSTQAINRVCEIIWPDGDIDAAVDETAAVEAIREVLTRYGYGPDSDAPVALSDGDDVDEVV